MTSKRLFLIVFLMASITVCGISLIACAGSKHGTVALYETPSKERLPLDEIARLCINDMKGFGKRLTVRFDSPREFVPEDTLEILPGRHGIQLRVNTADPKSPSAAYDRRESLARSCIYFEFIAVAGHQYEFRIADFNLDGWKIDLVDLGDTTRVVHGVGCRPGEWWLNRDG